MRSISEKLSQSCCDFSYANIPPSVLHQAKRCILDCLGVALAAVDHETTDILCRHIQTMGGDEQSQIIGSDQLVSVEQAALVNGTMAHVHDFDDTHLSTVIHPSCTIIPAALAVGQWKEAGGKDLLEAVVTGMEAALRIGLAVNPEHYDRGWHITGTVGVFGAAIAAGRLLGLDAERMTAAIGTAATQSSGLRELFGTMGKPYLAGHAAANGVRAALLAEGGFSSSRQPLEAPRGWAQVVSSSVNLDRVLRNWGQHFEMLDVGIKPYPSGVVTHPGIDAVYRCRREHAVKAEDVKSAKLTAHPLVLELTGKKEPQTGLEAKFSIYHCVAAAFFCEKLGVSEFTERMVADPRIAQLRDKVTVQTDGSFRPDQARLEVVTKNGENFITSVEHVTGSPENPMSDDQLEEKFTMLTESVLGTDQAQKLMQMCWEVEQTDLVTLLAATDST